MMPLETPARAPRFIAWFCAIYLAASMGLLAVFFVPYGVDAEGISSPLFLGSWALLYAITWAILFIRHVPVYARDLPIFLLCALVVASALWSDNSGRTLVYGIAFISNIAFAFVLRRYFDLNGFLDLLLKTILVMTVSGVALNWLGFQPTRYIDVHDRTTLIGTEPIRGLSNHKITAGLYAAIGFVLAFSILSGLKRAAACLFLVFFILLTGSSASLAILVVGMGFLLCLRQFGGRYSPLVFFGIMISVGAVFGTVLVTNAEAILGLLGRDPTLTGRTTLWAWGLDVASQKPIWGWGFLGYIGSEQAQSYARMLPGFTAYDVPHFHNSYIQMLTELGIVGLGISLWIIIGAAVTLYAASLRESHYGARTACALVLMLMFAAVFIHVFFKYNDFPTVFFTFCLLSAGGLVARNPVGASPRPGTAPAQVPRYRF